MMNIPGWIGDKDWSEKRLLESLWLEWLRYVGFDVTLPLKERRYRRAGLAFGGCFVESVI